MLGSRSIKMSIKCKEEDSDTTHQESVEKLNILEQKSEQDYVIEIFPSLEEAAMGVEKHAIEGNTHFIIYYTSKEFGEKEFNFKRHQILFEDKSGKSKQPKEITFTGVPFIILGARYAECVYGRDHNKAQKLKNLLKALEQENAGKKVRKVRSKKKDCPARIFMRDVIFFPQFKAEKNTVYCRRVVTNQLKKAWFQDKSAVNTERKFYCRFPEPTVHRDHPLGKEPYERGTLNGDLYFQEDYPGNLMISSEQDVVTSSKVEIDHVVYSDDEQHNLEEWLPSVKAKKKQNEEPVHHKNTSTMELQAQNTFSGKEDTLDEVGKFENVRIEASVPNNNWSKEMSCQYEKYMQCVHEGNWTKVISYFDSQSENRLFPRCLPPNGKYFEYALFLNRNDKKIHCLVQFGSWLQGPKNFVHGGAIATIIDSCMGSYLLELGYQCATINLNVNYKKPLPIGTVGIIEANVDRMEGRKIFVSAILRNVDGSIVFDDATSVWFNFTSTV